MYVCSQLCRAQTFPPSPLQPPPDDQCGRSEVTSVPAVEVAPDAPPGLEQNEDGEDGRERRGEEEGGKQQEKEERDGSCSGASPERSRGVEGERKAEGEVDKAREGARGKKEEEDSGPRSVYDTLVVLSVLTSHVSGSAG